MRSVNRRSARQVGKRSGGFTLLEVMLAFVIFALSFATVLEIMAGSMRGVRRASDNTEVALLAQSIMDQVGTGFPLEESGFSGTALDRFDWQLDIYPYDPGVVSERLREMAEMSGVEMYQVDLDIGWQAGRRQRSSQFSTVRSVLANR